MLLAIPALMLVENSRGRQAWREYLDKARAAGDVVDLTGIIPPPVPDEENFAALPFFKPLFDWTPGAADPQTGLRAITWRDRAGIARLESLNVQGNGTKATPVFPSWRAGRFVDLVEWQEYYRGRDGEFPIAPAPQSPAADVALALSKFDGDLAQLRAGMPRAHARFPIRYQDHVGALLPHLPTLRNLAGITRLRSLAALAEGRAEDAKADLLLGFRLAAAVDGEPLLISHLVTIAMVEATVSALWEGLARQKWNEAQLAAFADALARWDFISGYQRAIRGERSIFTFGALEALRSNPRLFFSALAGGPGDAVSTLLWRFLPSGLIDYNKAHLGVLYDKLLGTADPVARRFHPAKVEALDKEFVQDTARSRWNPHKILAALLFPGVSKAQERSAALQVTVDMATIAVALERHRLKKGSLPETLDALVPEFLPRVPHDVMGGGPLRYHRGEAGRFTLYSIGWNGVDDDGAQAFKGGKAQTPDWRAGDWPWPQPAVFPPKEGGF